MAALIILPVLDLGVLRVQLETYGIAPGSILFSFHWLLSAYTEADEEEGNLFPLKVLVSYAKIDK